MNFWRKWRRNEDGGMTVEAVIWLPFLIGLFVMAAELANIFFVQNTIQRVVQNGTRLYSVGQFTEQSQLRTYITERLDQYGDGIEIFIDAGSGLQLVTTTVRVPSEDIMMTGLVASLLDFNVGATTTQYVEY